MKIIVSFLTGSLLILFANNIRAQEKMFKKIISSASNPGQIRAITQDHQGYIWFGVGTVSGGLSRYDGSETITYRHDPKNPNSLSNNNVNSLLTDSEGMIWVGTVGGGVNRFDPQTRLFRQFRHTPSDQESLGNDSVTAILEDHLGNIWIASKNILNVLDRKTGKFKHYVHDPGDPSSINNFSFIYSLYEDRQRNLWLATIGGGLDKYDRKSGKFIHYTHNPNNPNSIGSDSVSAVYEDSRGNFWIGSGGDKPFQKLDRETGIFTNFTNERDNPGMPAPPRLLKGAFNFTTFIHEDTEGGLWIGSNSQGINRFDPTSRTITHFGVLYNSVDNPDPKYDTLSGAAEVGSSSRVLYQSKNGLLWIGYTSGSLYMVNPFTTTIPYHPIKNTIAVNSFYKDDHGGLWIALQEGLLHKPANGLENKFVSDPNNPKSLSNNIINWIIPDPDGNLLLATYGGGVNVFNPVTQTFTTFRHSQTDTNSLSCDFTSCLYLDHQKNLWVSSDTGLSKLNLETGFVTRYLNDPKDSNTISHNQVYVVTGKDENIWAGTVSGLNRLNMRTGKWKEYLPLSRIQAIFYDSKNTIWAGTNHGLYQYSADKDDFLPYSYQSSSIDVGSVLNIIEDRKHNLWITSSANIFKISPERDSLRVYGPESGVHSNDLLLVDNIMTKDGELIFGDGLGYYAFYPETVNSKWIAPDLYISGFQMGSKEVIPGKGSPIAVPVSFAKEIKLKYNQNSFSFEFTALHFAIPGDIKYLYKLENYDSTWQSLGVRNRAYFFNVPPGKYVLHVKAVASNGAVTTKSIDVIISQPWYFTWWGIALQALALILLLSVVSYLRSRQLRRQNKVLEQKVSHRTKQLRESLDNLKATQSQLIQSEKMASLGELTAGIAHEIQNPLNFVNNFSEVNKELIDEMKQELVNGNQQEAIEIAENIKENEEKIIHHGKRADSIVKGMLQHSRASTGIKEPTDLNALCDEYFRLAYHGLRAKDKSFNATMRMDFDPALTPDAQGHGKIKLMQQDMGRVVLNLLTNAFYAVHKKQKELAATNLKDNNSGIFDPIVTVSTKKFSDHVEIRVKDNGDGIPKEVLEKIFQPFFTTKPAGEGTGLGLSLSYEIVGQSHEGQLRVISKHEGETYVTAGGRTEKLSESNQDIREDLGNSGTTFIISIPVK